MPYYPKNSKCSYLGCKNERSKLNTFCSEHGGKDSTFRETDSLYATKAWKDIRQAQLSKQPLCQACLLNGQVCMARHVDHVFPWRQYGAQAFRLNLFQSLCHEHHAHKTQLEQKGVYEHYQGKVTTYHVGDYPNALGGVAGWENPGKT